MGSVTSSQKQALDTYFLIKFLLYHLCQDLYYDSDWMDVIKTDKLQPSTPPIPLTEITVGMDISGERDELI
jgi:hypothetical protein